jgi:hypothetical protein
MKEWIGFFGFMYGCLMLMVIGVMVAGTVRYGCLKQGHNLKEGVNTYVQRKVRKIR